MIIMISIVMDNDYNNDKWIKLWLHIYHDNNVFMIKMWSCWNDNYETNENTNNDFNLDVCFFNYYFNSLNQTQFYCKLQAVQL
jgi:hypothetical protein